MTLFCFQCAFRVTKIAGTLNAINIFIFCTWSIIIICHTVYSYVAVRSMFEWFYLE